MKFDLFTLSHCKHTRMHTFYVCLHIVINRMCKLELASLCTYQLPMNVQIIISVTVMVNSKHMNNIIEDVIEVHATALN